MLGKRPLALSALSRSGTKLRLRALSAITLIPVVIALIVLGGYAWLITILVVGLLAGRELFFLLRRAGYQPNMALGLLWVALLILEGFRPAWGGLRPLMAAVLFLSLLWALFQRRKTTLADWALTIAGAAYVGGLLAHFVALRGRPDGLWWLFLGLTAVWLGDSGAFLVGLTMGRRKLWPRLSPRKTQEGTIGGFVSTILGVLGFVALCGNLAPHTAVARMGWVFAVSLGILLGPIALAGDLAVSLFKRQAQVKDSGNLIPGHGGMLDRIDSLLFAIPVVYYWALLIGYLASPSS